MFVSRAPKVQNGQNSLVFKIDLCINLNITVKGGLHQLTVHSCVEIMLCTRYTVCIITLLCMQHLFLFIYCIYVDGTIINY